MAVFVQSDCPTDEFPSAQWRVEHPVIGKRGDMRLEGESCVSAVFAVALLLR